MKIIYLLYSNIDILNIICGFVKQDNNYIMEKKTAWTDRLCNELFKRKLQI